MRRIVGGLPRRQMAARIAAVVWLDRQRVIAVDVARSAGCDLTGRRQLVRIRQWESRGAVIKLSVRPHRDRMATGTRTCTGREVRGHVIRYIAAQRLRLVPIRRMARHAVSRVQRVVVIDMAGGARCRRRRHVRTR